MPRSSSRRRCGTTSRRTRTWLFALFARASRQTWRNKIGPRKITVGDQEVSDTVEAQTALILVNSTRFAFKPGPRNYDRTWIRDGSSQALALLWAGLIEEAKTYVVWYSKRIYENGMVPPILNMDGTINRGYGSDIEFDAQGEFIGIAADIYRISRDRGFPQHHFRTRRPGGEVHRGALRANQCAIRPGDPVPWPLGSIH